MTPVAIVVGVIALIGIAVLIGAVKIVRPYQRGLVERLGKYKTTEDPGLRLIVPFIETRQLIDMREQVVDVPPQEVITKDNVVVAVDASSTTRPPTRSDWSTTSPTSTAPPPSWPRPTCVT